MSDDDRVRWNQRYAGGAYAERTHPSAYLVEWLPRLPTGTALDVACGAGRNAVYLARNGYRVEGVDISTVALARARRHASANRVSIDFDECDLDETLPGDRQWNLIVVVRYLDLPLVHALTQRLAPGGALVCEVHLQTARSVIGPSGERFRAAPGALRAALAPLPLLDDFEGDIVDPDGGSAAVARAIAQR